MITKEELQKQIDELQAQLNSMPDDKPTGRWKPKAGQEYWVLSSSGAPEIATWADDGFDCKVYSLNNVYQNKEEAEKALEQKLATVRVLDRIAELNATDTSDGGWLIGADKKTGSLAAVHDPDFYTMPSGYYGSEKTINTVIIKIPEDCLKMLGIEQCPSS